MNLWRYLFFGAASFALHNLAISAQPAKIESRLSPMLNKHAVTIQLASIQSAPAIPEKVITPKTNADKKSATPISSEISPPNKSLRQPALIKKIVEKKNPTKKTDQKNHKLKTPSPEMSPRVSAASQRTEKKHHQTSVKNVTKQQHHSNKSQKKQIDLPTKVKPAEPRKTATNDRRPQPAQASSAPPLVQQAQFKTKPKQPKYPRSARRRGLEGDVLVEVWLDAQGKQQQQKLLKSSGHSSLDQSALTAIAKWQFSPYRENGIPRPHRVHIPIRFKLD